MVVATPSGWQGVLAGPTGIQLGSRLISFNIWPGHPNCIEPGKRPRITLTPTLVLKGNKPVLGISIVGGDVQDQTTLRIVTGHIDFGMMPADLVTSPRFFSQHHVGSFNQPPPKLGVLSIQNKFDAKTITQLKSRGHILEITKEPPSRDTAIFIDQKTGLIHAAGNPETNRHAAAF
jgi:gamma-glutamyltranspeptidase/glutathione hydrolase